MHVLSLAQPKFDSAKQRTLLLIQEGLSLIMCVNNIVVIYV